MKRVPLILGLIVVLGSIAGSAGATPVINTYSPLFGPPGTVATIYGSGFGQTQGDSYVAAFNIPTNTYTKWEANSRSDTQIVVLVPGNMPLGKIYFIVEVDEVRSSGWHPFTVGIPPAFSKYSPLYENPATLLTIYGTGFDSVQGGSLVSVLGEATRAWTTWPARSWSDTKIVVEIPSDMPFGRVFLNVMADNLWSIGTFLLQSGHRLPSLPIRRYMENLEPS